jgi:hypothetical protein
MTPTPEILINPLGHIIAGCEWFDLKGGANPPSPQNRKEPCAARLLLQRKPGLSRLLH